LLLKLGCELPYRAAKRLQIGETPSSGINSGPSLHVALAGTVADIGACHGGGFSSSCGARNEAPEAWAELAGGMCAD
jgi:hypothetical protein